MTRFVVVVIVWIITLCCLGYTLPGAIATTRNTYNSGSVWLINIFLGWTIIGWIIAFFMSFSDGRHKI